MLRGHLIPHYENPKLGRALQCRCKVFVLNLRFDMLAGVTHLFGNLRKAVDLLLKEKDMHISF